MFNPMLMATGSQFVSLDDGLVAHYLLNNNADDSYGNSDGVVSGTVDFQGDKADFSSGSMTFEDGAFYSWWEDTGSGMTHQTSTTKPTIQTNTYSNLRVYSSVKAGKFLTVLQNEGCHPRGNDIQASEADNTTLLGLTPPTTEGLVAHYPLTGTAEDTAGNYDGTENGGLLYADDVEKGGVANFDGSNDYITTTADSTTVIAFSFWFKIDSHSNYDRLVVFGNGASNNDRFFVYQDTTTNLVTFRGRNTSGGSFPVSNQCNTTDWFNAVFQYNGSECELYIDGVYIGSTSGLGTLNTGQNYTTIGAGYANGYSYFFDGRISNLRIYDRILNTQEITDIYTYEKNLRPVAIDDGLVAYYLLETNSLDNHFNQYDGTNNTNLTFDGTSMVSESESVDSYFDISASASRFADQTLSVWVKPSGQSVDIGTVIRLSQTDQMEVSFTTDNKFLLTGVRQSNDSYITYTTADTYNTGEWYHIFIVRKTSSIDFYINGVLDNTLSWDNTFASSAYGNRIGQNNLQSQSFTRKFVGSIGTTRIYNKALSTEQMDIIHNIEKTKFGL
jgi:hypothetical protein